MKHSPQTIALLIAATLGLIAFFLPFIHFVEVWFVDIHFSGWNLVEAGLDAAEIGKFKRGRKILNFLVEQWQANKSFIDYVSYIGLLYIMIGPFIFLGYALRYLWAGLGGKPFHKGLIHLMIFSGFAYLGFYLAGQEYHIKMNFFNRAGLGYWLFCGSLAIGFLSRFFKTAQSSS